MRKQSIRHASPDAHRDPITGTAGAHPVGTGLGAAAGGSVGGAIGAVGGPVGAAIGIAAGAAAGGLLGKAIAAQTDPATENEYWRTHYQSRPYVESDLPYEYYEPAYRIGYEGWRRYRGRRFDDIEEQLRRDYEAQGAIGVEWDKARVAARDAWNRLTDLAIDEDDRDRDTEKHYRNRVERDNPAVLHRRDSDS
jgi:uncharacterized protein YcfJ